MLEAIRTEEQEAASASDAAQRFSWLFMVLRLYLSIGLVVFSCIFGSWRKKLCKPYKVETVSYTHLDVYKRQGPARR